MSAFSPKRKFSQNFLTDPRTADKIVAALEISPGDHILEIGPGTGVLTQRLAASSAERVVAIDVDPRSIELINNAPWSDNSRIHAIEGDVLNVQISKLFAGVPHSSIKVIGNIPYSITSDILFWLFGCAGHVGSAVILMQREVANRCTGVPGTKDYGVLAVAAWYATTPKMLFHIKPGSFFPKPQVTSALVRFQFRMEPPIPLAATEFMEFVKAAFSQRRKVISNSIGQYVDRRWGSSIRDVDHTALSADPTHRRAEELTPMELYQLWTELDLQMVAARI